MSGGYNFSNAKNIPALRYINTGIHEVTVLEVYYQPVGDSVKGERKKEITAGANDGPLVNFTKAQTRIVLQVDKTVAGNESKGAITTISLYEPQSDDPKKFEGQVNRIFHILTAMTTTATVPLAEAYVRAFPGQSTEEFADYIKVKFTGKKARYKFIADQDGKFAQLPNYYNGFAECIDAPMLMKYNEEKEGVAKKTGVELAKDDRDIATNGLAPSDPIRPAQPVTPNASAAGAQPVNIFASANANNPSDLPF